jgi:predicted 3-demethylubiquinone-9 3-methyltransferase (glyoxalase superfamily)
MSAKNKVTNKIHPHLWYTDKAREAAEYYVSIFPDSKIERISDLPSDSPSGPAGSVEIVEFRLFGQPFMAMSAGKLDDFNHSISFMVSCDDQAELDRYWDALLEGGGVPEQCGWVCDRYGVRWQIVPASLQDMMADSDREKARRVSDVMLKMEKFDIAELEAAYEGEPVGKR